MDPREDAQTASELGHAASASDALSNTWETLSPPARNALRPHQRRPLPLNAKDSRAQAQPQANRPIGIVQRQVDSRLSVHLARGAAHARVVHSVHGGGGGAVREDESEGFGRVD